MNVSVVVCTHDDDRFPALCDAVESVLAQTYPAVELIIVVDGNDSLAERCNTRFGALDTVTVLANPSNRGLSYSRSQGVTASTGDIIAFLDDDAVATEDWIQVLVDEYEQTDAIAVGGRMVPAWVTGRPSFFPDEFSWLIGVTYAPRLTPGTEVRNTLGSNLSFRREVFATLGGFDETLGVRGTSLLQGEETEFCLRMRAHFGKGVRYTPEAVVAHKVFPYRTDPWWLIRRAFWQGYSKRILRTRAPDTPSQQEESRFLRHLFSDAVPGRLRSLLAQPSVSKFLQLNFLFVLTISVGLGYGYGLVMEKRHR